MRAQGEALPISIGEKFSQAYLDGDKNGSPIISNAPSSLIDRWRATQVCV